MSRQNDAFTSPSVRSLHLHVLGWCLAVLVVVPLPTAAQPLDEILAEGSMDGPSPASIDEDPEPVCVVTAKARLRVAPGKSARVSWIVGKHMPLERLVNRDGWSKVRDLRGQQHWVVSSAVSTTEACAVVRVRLASLHTLPSPGAPRSEFKAADRYTAFKRVARETGWVRIEDTYRGSFWTRESNLWIPTRKTRIQF